MLKPSDFVSIDAFYQQMFFSLEHFKNEYKRQHDLYPDIYPYVIAKDNSGVWLEMFLIYLETGEV